MSSLRKQVSRFKLVIIILTIIILVLGGMVLFRPAKTKPIPDASLATAQVRIVERIVSAEGKLAGISDRAINLSAGYVITEVKVKNGDRVQSDQVLFLTRLNGINREIKSPTAGIVGGITVAVGETITAPTVVAKVVDDSEFRITLQINEAEIYQVAKDQVVRLIFNAVSQTDVYDATVVEVDPIANSNSTAVNYAVVIKPNSIPTEARIGMSVDAEIVTAKVEKALSIPEGFLIERDNKLYVKLINWTNNDQTEYTTTEKEVTIGLRTNEFAEMKSGLQESDQILDPAFVLSANRRFGLF